MPVKRHRLNGAIIVLAAVVICALYLVAMSASCEARGGHLDWSVFRRDPLCLTDDGRVVN